MITNVKSIQETSIINDEVRFKFVKSLLKDYTTKLPKFDYEHYATNATTVSLNYLCQSMPIET